MKTFAWLKALALLLLAIGQGMGPVFSEESLSSDDQGAAEPPVADPAGADEEPVSPRIEAHNRFLRLNDEERYSEARFAAQQVVDLTREEYGPDAIELATPLVNLATMQMRNEQLEFAEQIYRDAIAIIESHEKMLSKRLINPLTGLGATYNRLGLYDQAIKTFDRALRINHVNDGFYNFEQFKVYDGLTEGYVGQQEIEDANFYQEIQLEIYQRKIGVNDPGIVPGLYKLADWYKRSGQLELAMQSYRRADDILRKGDSEELSLQRVEALEGMAHVYESGGNQSAGASVFKRALDIIDAQSEIDYRMRATVMVKLGDLYTRSGRSTSAEKYYAEAWRDLSRDDVYLDLRDQFFANPVRVAGRQLSSLAHAPNTRGKSPDTLEDGYVLISYTVNSNGRAEDVKVIESDPPDMMDQVLVSTFQRSWFRARRIDDEAVDADRLFYQLDFRYATESRMDKPRKSLEYPDAAIESDSEDEDGARGGRLPYPEKASE